MKQISHKYQIVSGRSAIQIHLLTYLLSLSQWLTGQHWPPIPTDI